jgi:preprotein translocase subunit SecG
VRQHLSIGANMVMARITAFIAVYFVARSITDNETTVSR